MYPAQYAILQNSALNNSFTGVQFAYNGTTDSASFGAGGMPTALALAVSNHICYWELWNQDILNTAFDSLFTNITCSPASLGTPINETKKHATNVYPNPASEVLHLSFKEMDNHNIWIYDVMGKLHCNFVTSIGLYTINTTNWPNGIYVVVVESLNNREYIKVHIQNN